MTIVTKSTKNGTKPEAHVLKKRTKGSLPGPVCGKREESSISSRVRMRAAVHFLGKKGFGWDTSRNWRGARRVFLGCAA